MTVFLRFTQNDGPARYGLLDGTVVTALEGNPFGSWKATKERFSLEEVSLLAPCEPTKVVCVGVNYKAVLAAKGQPAPAEPIIFIKPPSTVIGPDAAIEYPRGLDKLGYEVELAVVIKERVRNVPREDALKCVLGYSVSNDLTAKDYMGTGPWTKGKCFDTFLPLGPWIATDVNPDDAPLRSFLNGTLAQDSNTSDMVFSVADVIAYISGIMTLNPGDVICMGTPPGAGTLKPGDSVEVVVDGIGTLRNPVIAL